MIIWPYMGIIHDHACKAELSGLWFDEGGMDRAIVSVGFVVRVRGRYMF